MFSFFTERMYLEFCTQKSSGGILVFLFYFFTTYCTAVIFWTEKGDIETDEGQVCLTLLNCMRTMISLSLQGTTGLSYLDAITLHYNQNYGYICLLWIYLIFNGIVLFNGLIGIFASTFTGTDETIKETSIKLSEVEERLERLTALIEFQHHENKDNNATPVKIDPLHLDLKSCFKENHTDANNNNNNNNNNMNFDRKLSVSTECTFADSIDELPSINYDVMLMQQEIANLKKILNEKNIQLSELGCSSEVDDEEYIEHRSSSNSREPDSPGSVTSDSNLIVDKQDSSFQPPKFSPRAIFRALNEED